MDEIKEKVEAVVEKLKKDPALMKEFKTEPVKVLEKVLGVDLPDDLIAKIIDGVKTKIAVGDIADSVEDVIGTVSNIFAKFKK